MKNRIARAVLRVVLPYVLFATLWISLSDHWVETLLSDPAARTQWSIYKGCAFVIVTALLLYCLLRMELKSRERVEVALRESKEHLWLALDAAQMGQWDLNIVTGEVVWSPECLALYGLPPGTHLNREEFLVLVHPDDRPDVNEAIRRAVEERANYENERRVVWPDGSIHWLASRGRVHCDATSRPVHMIGVSFDITARKKAEEALRESEARAQKAFRVTHQRLENIIEHLPDATFAIDQDKRVIAWNRACEIMTGVKKDAVLGQGDYIYAEPFYGKRCPIMIDLLDQPSPEVESHYTYVQRVGDTITAAAFNPRMRGGQGAYLWGTAAPLFDQEGRRCGAIEVMRDVTEQKRVEQALRESELKHRTLFETATDAILLIRGDRFFDCNPEALRVFGRSREEIVGTPLHKLSVPTQPDGRRSEEKALEILKQAMAGGPQFIEWEYCRPDGIPFTAELSLNRLELDGDVLLQMLLRDITARKYMDKALRQSEATIRSVFRAAPVGICIVKDRVFRSVNQYWCEKFGYPERSLLGKSTRLVYESDEEWNRVGGIYDQLRTQGLASIETRHRCSDGSVREVILTAAPIQHDDFSAGVVTVTYDITERKRAEEKIRQLHEDLQRHAAELEQRVADRTAELAVARDQAEAANLLKSAFLATMSHELRTPLNSIIGFTGIILQGLAGPLSAEQTKQLEMVRGSARHLLALINDVLDISKIEAMRLKVTREPFNMRASIGKTVELVKPLAEKKGLAFRVEIAPDVSTMVSDQRRVEQILVNLLNNAIKFTEHGQITLTVEVAWNMLRISVKDTGIGIKQEDLEKLFQPFRQVDTGLARNREGTGLGLAICRRLVELLGGEIHVESEWGKGSTFTVLLPGRSGAI
ncbi:MAG: PAS domain S-box protein [Verrucomicrobiia bacterium]